MLLKRYYRIYYLIVTRISRPAEYTLQTSSRATLLVGCGIVNTPVSLYEGRLSSVLISSIGIIKLVESKWHNFSVQETLARLNSRAAGLARAEVETRFQQYGPNELAEKARTPAILVFLRQFASPLIYILLIAAIIEFTLLENPTAAGVILAVVFINSIIGFIQERRAEKAVESLKRLAVPQAKVKERDMLPPLLPRVWFPAMSLSLRPETKSPPTPD
jgi:magnesium-transporting ATPase (P-type)